MTNYHASIRDKGQQQVSETFATMTDAIDQIAEWLGEDPEFLLWRRFPTGNHRVSQMVCYHTDNIRAQIVWEEDV